MDDFKRAIISEEFNDLNKTAMIEMLARKFSTQTTKQQVKTTLEAVAERQSVPGQTKRLKRWVLAPDFAF